MAQDQPYDRAIYERGALRVLQPRLSFEHGTVRIDGAGMLEIPNATYDDRSKTLRAYAMHHADITRYLEESEIPFDDGGVLQYEPMPALRPALGLRDYQQDAISRWKRASMRGCVVLPTGSGKTAVGMAAICEAAVPALVVVPTIDLLEQWVGFLQKSLVVEGYGRPGGGAGAGAGAGGAKGPGDGGGSGGRVDVGMLGGGSDDIKAVTVATYDSAYLKAPAIGNRFGLLVFDEVHHLPAPGYRLIAEQCVAPFRLGLTATLEREDGLHRVIPRLVGGVVYRRGTRDLAEKKHLAGYDVRRIRVSLTDAERAEYGRCRAEFLAGFNALGMRSESMYNLKRLIMMSNRNKNARAALLARNRANEIAFNTAAKTEELRRILRDNCGGAVAAAAACGDASMRIRAGATVDAAVTTATAPRPKKTIIFTQNNKMAYAISDTFLMPIITHKTAKAERREILDGFRAGRYVAIVTSRVLDEGVDVPDAELGIVVSGTGSGREMVQRLGRLLRPKSDGGRALLIEMVSENTRETGSSERRTAALRRNAAAGGQTGRGGKSKGKNRSSSDGSDGSSDGKGGDDAKGRTRKRARRAGEGGA